MTDGPLRSTSTGQSTRPTTAGAATGFLGAALGAAALRERLGELSKFDFAVIGGRKFLGQSIDASINGAQKVKEHRFPVEEVLNIDQGSRQVLLSQQVIASVECAVAKTFQSVEYQFVFAPHDAQEISVGRWRIDVANDDSPFQPARGATNDPPITFINTKIGRVKGANNTHEPDFDKVTLTHDVRYPI